MKVTIDYSDGICENVLTTDNSEFFAKIADLKFCENAKNLKSLGGNRYLIDIDGKECKFMEQKMRTEYSVFYALIVL